MRLKSKLAVWQKQKFITDQQCEDILSYERQKMSRHFSLGMQLCGGFAILLGFALIVAANWHELGRYAKLSAHFILSAGLSYWLFKTGYDQKKPILQEMLCLGVFGLNLTFIALIGQVFQLDGSTATALVVWMVISTPTMMVYARASYTAWLWTVALYVTAIMAFSVFVEDSSFASHLDDYAIFMMALFLGIFVPLALYADHCVAATRIFRPAFASAFRKSSLLVMVIGASFASVWFYDGAEDVIDDAGSVFLHYGFISIIAFLALGYIAFIMRHFKNVVDMSFDGKVLALCVLFILLPFFIPLESELLAAIAFIAFWIGMGIMGQKFGEEGLVNLSITFVTLRLYMMFLELFGSLMQSGFGLIIAGVILIGMVKGAHKFKQRLKKHHTPITASDTKGAST